MWMFLMTEAEGSHRANIGLLCVIIDRWVFTIIVIWHNTPISMRCLPPYVPDDVVFSYNSPTALIIKRLSLVQTLGWGYKQETMRFGYDFRTQFQYEDRFPMCKDTNYKEKRVARLYCLYNVFLIVLSGIVIWVRSRRRGCLVAWFS